MLDFCSMLKKKDKIEGIKNAPSKSISCTQIESPLISKLIKNITMFRNGLSPISTPVQILLFLVSDIIFMLWTINFIHQEEI